MCCQATADAKRCFQIEWEIHIGWFGRLVSLASSLQWSGGSAWPKLEAILMVFYENKHFFCSWALQTKHWKQVYDAKLLYFQLMHWNCPVMYVHPTNTPVCLPVKIAFLTRRVFLLWSIPTGLKEESIKANVTSEGVSFVAVAVCAQATFMITQLFKEYAGISRGKNSEHWCSERSFQMVSRWEESSLFCLRILGHFKQIVRVFLRIAMERSF